MLSILSIVFGLIIVAAVVYLLIKRVETRLVLLGAGFIMAIASLKPLIAFEAFSNGMVSSGLIQTICSVMGFAFVMKYTECDKHLIHALVKVLAKFRFALIPGACILTFIVNISLTSAAGVSAAVGTILIPLLISMGVAPATAAAAIIVGNWGSMISPGLSHQPIIARLANMEIIDVIKVHALTDVVTMLVAALSLTIIAKIFKEDKGYIDPEGRGVDLNVKVNPLYAILPLVPVVLLLILNNGSVRANVEWAKLIKVPHAMLFGAFLCFVVTRKNPAQAVKEFFNGMGKAYGDIFGIIISAGVFVSGMKALGMIDAFVEFLKGSTHLVPVAATYGPFLLGVLSGSGDAAAIAFNESVTIHAPDFGLEIANMGALAGLSGALGRAMSPIAGATIVVATIANVNPFEVAKRNAVGAILASVVAMFMLVVL